MSVRLNGLKILVSVVRFRPRAPFSKTISMTKFSRINAMRVRFKNTPNTHFSRARLLWFRGSTLCLQPSEITQCLLLSVIWQFQRFLTLRVFYLLYWTKLHSVVIGTLWINNLVLCWVFM
jgi:hypothetical protein